MAKLALNNIAALVGVAEEPCGPKSVLLVVLEVLGLGNIETCLGAKQDIFEAWKSVPLCTSLSSRTFTAIR